ncbi:MAG: hypothetical protein B7Y87_00980 [Sphingomonadales bacterium 32-64-22]|nr:MAG: hypothetical protein B7Y87_00980 [Sphingomonadales bacterium 32-64-22]
MTADEAGATRGRPVVAMVAVLAVWVSLRLAFWQSPLLLQEARSELALADPGEALARYSAAGAEFSERRARIDRDFQPLVTIELARLGEGGAREWVADTATEPSDPAAESTLGPSRSVALAVPGGLGCSEFRRVANDRCSAPSPQRGEAPRADRQATALASAAAMADPVFAPMPSAPSRWLASSWLFWRDDGQSGRQAATTPNYGRSQAGAVLAYQLAPESMHRPQGYVRATTALEGPRESDLAAGLSARPLPDVPVRLAAEARLSLRDGANELRPAAFVVTELAPFVLPAQMAGEVYAQAGWVGGDFATGFVDAQMRLTRALTQSRDFALSAGGGAWAGAQKGTRRVDVGPSINASFRVGDKVYGRLSADYRMRVAGNAAPASGPALTLSAGF